MSEGVYVSVDTDTGAGIVLATVNCELVGARESPIIEAEVRAKGPSRGWKIVMDLKGVTLLASMGLGMLVNLNRACANEGGRLVVCNVSPDIMGVMKVTHLDRIIKIVPDIEAAKKLLR
jgi:anti-anti-sigma factor